MKRDDKVIHINDLIRLRDENKVKDLKEELDRSILDLDIDIEAILSSLVFFNNDEYNNVYPNEIDEKQMIVNNLIFTIASLDMLGFHEAAEDIQKVINKLNNNSCGENDEN
jgi:hypothetical protein